MDISRIKELMKLVSESEFADFEYEEDGLRLKLKKLPDENAVLQTEADGAHPRSDGNPVPSELKDSGQMAPPQSFGTAEEEDTLRGNIIKSPLVGTFYAATSPEADPLVQVGDTVAKGQVIGIVEAMKLMNEIESDFDGIVKQILVKNGDVIEYDQPLFVIE